MDESTSKKIEVFLIITSITCMIRASLSQKPTDPPPPPPRPRRPRRHLWRTFRALSVNVFVSSSNSMVDQDENESGNPGHIHPGASALLSGGVFIEKEVSRGEGSLPLRLTDSSPSEEDRP